jgi:hypothetical protein
MPALAVSGAGSGPERLERARLATLRDEIGDRCLESFVKAFLILLDERLDRIGAAVSGRTTDALRAARDLWTGGAMLGAARLCELLRVVDAPLRARVPASPTELANLRAEAQAVTAALASVLEETGRR